MKKGYCNFILMAILMLLAACNKQRLQDIAPGPVNNNALSGPNDSKLLSRIYLITELPSRPDTTKEITLSYDITGRLAYTVGRNWNNIPNAATQGVSYYYNGADTLPAAVMKYNDGKLTETIFNNYVNGILVSDSSVTYTGNGIPVVITSTLFQDAGVIVKDRAKRYRLINGTLSVFSRDSLTCRSNTKDNNGNTLNWTMAYDDSPGYNFSNGLYIFTSSYDTGINPLYYYFTHGNTDFDLLDPGRTQRADRLLSAVKKYSKNALSGINALQPGQVPANQGNYSHTFTNQYDTAGRLTVINQTYSYPFFSIQERKRIAFVYKYP